MKFKEKERNHVEENFVEKKAFTVSFLFNSVVICISMCLSLSVSYPRLI